MVHKIPILSVYGGCKAHATHANTDSGGVVYNFISVTALYFIFLQVVFSHPDIQRCGKLTDLGASRNGSPFLVGS